MVGNLANLEQEGNLESYWKALGPSRSTLLESKDSYPNCIYFFSFYFNLFIDFRERNNDVREED